MTPNLVEKQCLVNNPTITTVVLDLEPCTWASALSLATISNMIFSQQSSCHTPSLAHYCLQPATVTRDCSFPDTDHTRTNKLYIHLQDLIVIKPIQKRLDLARVTKNKGSHLNDLNHWLALALALCSPPRIFESRKPAQPNIHSSQPPLASRNFTFCGQFTFFSVPRPLFGFPATFSRICSAVVQQRLVSQSVSQSRRRPLLGPSPG